MTSIGQCSNKCDDASAIYLALSMKEAFALFALITGVRAQAEAGSTLDQFASASDRIAYNLSLAILHQMPIALKNYDR